MDDVGKVFDSEPGNIIVPNRGLKPEFTYNFEAGITKTIADNMQIYLVSFYTLLDDTMVRRGFTFNGSDSIVFDGTLSRVQALVNAGEAFIYGGSLQLRWNLSDQVYFKTSHTFSSGEDKADNIPLRHTTPIFGFAALGYRKEKIKIELNTHYSGKRRFDDLPPSEQNKTHLYTPEGSLA